MSMGMNRRDLLERALLLVGAAAATSSGFVITPTTAAARAKSYLDQPTLRLLSAVADALIPETETVGAVGANVPASFDALLARWASGEHRYQLVTALKAIDAKAREAHGKGFAELPPEHRHSLLSVHDEQEMQAELARGPAGPRTAGLGRPYPAYARLKELVVLLYYISQPALTQELSYEHSPGEWKPSVPVTTETRTAGGGLI